MMKKSMLKRLVLAAVVAGSFAAWQPASEAAVQVNPVVGMPADFIKGADVSMIPEMEKYGAKFYDVDGTEMDCLQVLKNHGVNWVRFRIWNDPAKGQGGGGNTDEARAIEMTRRAKALGMKVLIDFHYSDWWADPGKQYKPHAWEGHSKEQLVQDVYDYTAKVLKDFQAQGLQPEMIQVGNEVKSGMIWPEGKLPSDDGDLQFSRMVAAGLKAIHDNDPKHEIKTMIHLPDGGDNAVYRNFFDSLINKHGVNDFDIIGMSYYPFWHGTMQQLQENMDDVSKRYNKDVIVVETAFGYTNKNFDDMPNPYGETAERIGGYRSTVQGQATGLRDLMEHVVAVPNHRGTGIFYWEPDWYAVPGVGWKTGEGDEWDNLTMFDDKGKALESMKVWSEVSNPNAKTVPVTFKAFDNLAVEGGVGAPVELPEKTRMTYTDDHAENLPVTWNNPRPVFNKTGVYTVKGKVAGNKTVTCQVTVVKKVNLVQNPAFESVKLDGWTITGDKQAVDCVSKAGDALGQGAMHYWAADAFHFTAQQSFTGLKDGKYTVAVSTQGGGGQKLAQLFIIGDKGQKLTADIKDEGWNKWHVTTIKDVVVKDGKATIGVEMDAAPGNWGSLDNFEFYLQE